MCLNVWFNFGGPERGIAEEGREATQHAQGIKCGFGVDDRGWVLGRVLRGLRMELGMRATGCKSLSELAF